MTKMLDKYFFACLVFTLVKNAVCEISLDYYFGFEDTLRTARYMENCNNDGVSESCQQRCGPNHACLLGKCFCVEVKPQIKEDVLDELLRRSKPKEQDRKAASAGDSSSESESEENGQKKTKLEEMALRPALRHHIAHFCANLDKARKCIHKCMIHGKPAFCGKDHVCYCGHRYGTPRDDEESSSVEYGLFHDLYLKYFGPNHKTSLIQPETALNTTTSTTTPSSTTSSTTTPSTTTPTTTTQSTPTTTTDTTTTEFTTENEETSESITEAEPSGEILK